MSITSNSGKVTVSLTTQSSGVNSITVGSQTFSIPVTLSSMDNVSVFTGTYTPNNDFQFVNFGYTTESGVTEYNSPNFLLFICDGLCVIQDMSNYYLGSIPCNKILFTSVASAPNDQPFQGLKLLGYTNLPVPMAQGVPVNWTCICGQATVS